MRPRRAYSTQSQVNSLLADPHRQISYYDSREAGLSVRVSPGGGKAYYINYRINRRQVHCSIGKCRYLSLAEARRRAKQIRALVDQGKDPAAEQLRVGRERRSKEFGDAVEDYIRLHAEKRTKGWKETRRLLEKNFADWRNLRLRDIDRTIVRDRCDALAESAPGSANNGFAALRAFFNWCVRYDLCEVSPCALLRKPAPTRFRDRVLSADEIRAVMGAAETTGGPFGDIVRLLFFTAQRKAEVAGMLRSEVSVEQGVWEIPASRTKAHRRHRVPLVKSASEIVKGRMTHRGEELLFPARGASDHPVSGFSKWKRELDLASGVKDWRLHDIRRTVATMLGQQGVAPHVIGKILNHGDAVPGPTNIYMRHDYIDEARSALEAWENYLITLLGIGQTKPAAEPSDVEVSSRRANSITLPLPSQIRGSVPGFALTRTVTKL